MSRRVRKLTPSLLRKMVLEEKRKMVRETSDPIASGIEDPSGVKPEEVDAADQANTLEKDIDHLKVLKIKEGRLRKQLRRVQESRARLRRRVVKKL